MANERDELNRNPPGADEEARGFEDEELDEAEDLDEETEDEMDTDD